MKIIIIIACIFSIAFASCSVENVANKCPYEGAECPNAQSYLRDYQIELHMDTVWLYDGDRLVGQFINSTPNSTLDSIILKDNL